MEDGDNVMNDQFPDDFSTFSEDTVVIDADPISYFLPRQSSSSSTIVDFSSMSATIDDDANSPFLSLFTLVSENPSNPTFSLSPQVSENLATLKPIGNNNPPPLSAVEPSTDLCLSLPFTPDTSSTIATLRCSIGSQDSSALASSNCVAKRSLFQGPISISKSGEDKFVPVRVKKESTNNAKRQSSIIQPAAVPSTDLCLSLPSTDLCLSLPYTPDTSSTITTLQCSNGSQDSSVLASSNCAAKRSLFQGPISISKSVEEKFVPVRVRKELANNAKQQRLIIQPVASAAAGEQGHWITKKLTKSDVNGASRLLLPRQEVKNYILPFMDEEKQAIICHDIRGIDVTVLDLDTETEHNLTLKKWSTDSFQLVKAWTGEFVRRRNLKQDDVISIRWEKNNSRFCFQVQMRNQVDGV